LNTTEFYAEIIGRDICPESPDLAGLLARILPSPTWKHSAPKIEESEWSALFLSPSEKEEYQTLVLPDLHGHASRRVSEWERDALAEYDSEYLNRNPEPEVTLFYGLTPTMTLADVRQKPPAVRVRFRATLLPINLDEANLEQWAVESVFDPLLEEFPWMFGRMDSEYGKYPPLYGIDLERHLWQNCASVTYFGPRLARRLSRNLSTLLEGFVLRRAGNEPAPAVFPPYKPVRYFPDGGVRAHFLTVEPDEVLFS